MRLSFCHLAIASQRLTLLDLPLLLPVLDLLVAVQVPSRPRCCSRTRPMTCRPSTLDRRCTWTSRAFSATSLEEDTPERTGSRFVPPHIVIEFRSTIASADPDLVTMTPARQISIPPASTVDITALLAATEPVRLTGLGPRDSLRLEAGMCLYGHDLDESISPVEAGLSWVIGQPHNLPLSRLSPLSRLTANLISPRLTLHRQGPPSSQGLPRVVEDPEGACRPGTVQATSRVPGHWRARS